jgi:hypothetical protein
MNSVNPFPIPLRYLYHVSNSLTHVTSSIEDPHSILDTHTPHSKSISEMWLCVRLSENRHVRETQNCRVLRKKNEPGNHKIVGNTGLSDRYQFLNTGLTNTGLSDRYQFLFGSLTRYDTPVEFKWHTHPSHSQTSRLLTSSVSSGVPVPRATPCVCEPKKNGHYIYIYVMRMIYIYIYICVCVCVCVCIYVSLSLFIYVYIYVCVYICICICIYIYVYHFSLILVIYKLFNFPVASSPLGSYLKLWGKKKILFRRTHDKWYLGGIVQGHIKIVGKYRGSVQGKK